MQNQCNAKFYYDQYKYVLCNSDKQKKVVDSHKTKQKWKNNKKNRTNDNNSLIAERTQWQTRCMNGAQADKRTNRTCTKRAKQQRIKKKNGENCLFYLDADGSATVVSIFIKLVLYIFSFLWIAVAISVSVSVYALSFSLCFCL